MQDKCIENIEDNIVLIKAMLTQIERQLEEMKNDRRIVAEP